MKINFFILLVLSLFQVFGQQELHILSVDQSKPIPFATLFFTASKSAYLSDENGLFIIPEYQVNQEASVQHISYESKTFTFQKALDTILLSSKSYEISTIELLAAAPIDLIKKAIDAIPINYPKWKFYLQGNYRQTHKENHVYVRLIEAQLFVANDGMRINLNAKQEESFAISKLRKSYNYEKNGDQHGDHLVDLFAENPIQYLEQSVLNKSNLNLYVWSLAGSTPDTYKISFQNKSWSSAKNISGHFIINKDNYAIEAISLQEFPNPLKPREGESNWRLINAWYEASFKQQGTVYVLDTCTKWYNHEVRHALHQSEIAYLVEEKFEWQTNSFKDTISSSEKFSQQSNLYSASFTYDEKDWQNFKLPEKIKQDLEHRHPLEYQFQNP